MRKTAVLGLLALGAAVRAESILTSYESSSDLQLPKLEQKLGTASVSSQYVTNGSRSMALNFEANSQYNPYFYTVFSTAKNFTNVGIVTLDVANTSPVETRITFQLVDEAGKKAQYGFNFKVGQRKRIGLVIGDRSSSRDVYMHNWPVYVNDIEARQPNITDGFNAAKVKKVGFSLRMPETSTQFVVDNLVAKDPFKYSTYMRGGLDAYGQRAFGLQAGLNRVLGLAELSARLVSEVADNVANPPPSDRRPSGAYNRNASTASGFFRTGKRNNKWWLFDAQGYPFFSTGMDGLDPNQKPTIVTGKQSMFAWLPSQNDYEAKYYGTDDEDGTAVKTFNFARLNFERKYGNDDAWWDHQLNRLQSWGFNTIGSWSDEGRSAKRNGKMPYIIGLGDGSGVKTFYIPDGQNAMPDPYDSGFTAAVSAHCAATIGKFDAENDPLLIGYAHNNELPWRSAKNALSLPLGILGYSSSALAAKAQLVSRIRSEYGTIGALNEAWETNFSSWDQFSGPVALATVTVAADSDLRDYLRSYAVKFFSTWKAAIRAADPNHMYLGCRMSHNTPEVLWAAKPYVSVFMFTHYGATTADAELGGLGQYDKPVMLSEYTKAAYDRNCLADLGNSVETQADRVEFLTGVFNWALDHPNIVGLHYYRLYDDPVLGSSYMGMNYNNGVVDHGDTPYPEVIQMFRQLNSTIYTRRK